MTIQYVPPVTWVDNPEDFMKFARHVRDTGECAHDTETTGLNRSTDHVLFWSACPDEQTRYCFSREMLRLWDAELAKDQDIKWYYTNQTFDFDMLMNSGVRVPLGDSYCTLAMDWLLDENRQGRHGLKETALDYLGLNMREFKEAFKGKKKGESYHERLLRAMEEEFESATSYASLDAWATFRVFHELKRRLQAEDSDGMCLWDYFEEVEMPFTRVLHSCSRRGIRVDLNYLEELSPKLEADIVKLQRKISKLAGTEVNPNSPKQLQRLFFDKLGLKPIKMTSGGASGNRQPSTDASCLEIWADDGVEAAELILQHRELAKMKGTYVDGLRKWVDTNLRIHPTLTQHVTVTGRLSSVDPNLQNIPRAGTDKYAIRSAFRAKPGHILIVADYEQLEMRLLAHFSQDPNMIDVIRKGWDIHTGTASLMFGYEYEEIKAALKKNKLATKDENMILTALEIAMCFSRQSSKSIGFGINYGEGPKKLAKTLGVSIQRAKELMAQYFEPYPDVKNFIESVHAYLLDNAKVETILGRPRRFHEMVEIGKMLDKRSRWNLPGTAKKNLARAERQSLNSVIQGCKRASSRVTTTHGMIPLVDLKSYKEAGSSPPLITYSGQTTNYIVHDTGEKDVYRLSTSHGTDYLTKEHRMFQYENRDLGVVQLKDLKVGDFILASESIIHGSKSSVKGSVHLAELIGVLCGDGSYTRDRDFRICFGNDMAWGEYLQRLLKQEFGEELHCPIVKSSGSLGNSYHIEVSRKEPRQVLLEAGLANASRDGKTIPEWIFHSPAEYRAACLRGLYDSDGTMLAGRYPQFVNISLALVEGFQTLCHSLGMFCRVSCDNNETGHLAYRATVISECAETFLSTVQPAIESKRVYISAVPITPLPPELIKDVAEHITSNALWHAEERITRKLINSNEGSWRTRAHTCNAKKHFTRGERSHVYRMREGSGTQASCLKFLHRLKAEGEANNDTENLIDLCQQHWAKVRNIEGMGAEHTMDVEILDSDHSYIGGGLLQHNSAADVARVAMIKCELDIRLRRLKAEMLLQVHDELIFEVPEENADEAMKIVKENMEHPFADDLLVPLDVDCGKGYAWSEAKA